MTFSLRAEPESSFTRFITPQIARKAHQGFNKTHGEVIDAQYTIKIGAGITSYGYRILELLERLKIDRVPRPIAFFSVNVQFERGWPFNDIHEECMQVIIMSTIPGKTSFPHNLTEVQQFDILADVKHLMNQINTAIIENPEITFRDQFDVEQSLQIPTTTISNLDGNRCFQFPLMEGWFSEAIPIENFNAQMTAVSQQPSELAEYLQTVLQVLHSSQLKDQGEQSNSADASDQSSSPHTIRFSHMDLHTGNFLVEDGRLSGIIDWEHAGWYTLALDAWASIHRLAATEKMKGLGDKYVTAWGLDSSFADHIRRQRELHEGHMRWETEYHKKKGIELGYLNADGTPTDDAAAILEKLRKKNAEQASIDVLSTVAM